MSQFELIQSEKLGDRVWTPDWAALDMIQHFGPTGRILEPFRGAGVFLKYMPSAEWCEVDEGRDFFKWTERVDWIVTNPPFSLLRDCWRHAARVSDNIVFLCVVRNFFTSDGFMREVESYGGFAEIRCYGPGGKLGFPMGNLIGAIHCKRGHLGGMKWSRALPPERRAALGESDAHK